MRRVLPLAAVLVVACKNDKGEGEIQQENHAPVADAGEAIRQTADDPVTLDGGSSYDPDGDTIAFHWEFDSVPSGSTLLDQEDPFQGNDTTSATARFWADAPGTYIVKLVVTDEHGAQSAPDFVVVEIEPGDAPVANAGPDLEGVEGDTFTLDGSGSYDPLGRELSYAWTLSVTPDGSKASLDDPNSATPSFVADVGGIYVASLVVSNGITESDADAATIRVSSADPQPPTAVVDETVTGEDCTEITLDGSGSFDPNGDALSYLWTLQQKPEGSSATNDDFADRTAATTTFIGDVAGTYVVSLAVSDGTSWSTPALVTLELSERSYNTPPQVEAGSARAVDGGEATCTESGYTYDCDDCADQTVALGDDAVVTDADGDATTVTWTVVSGDATIDDPSSLQTTVTLTGAAPTQPGACEDTEYEFQLEVRDCTGETTTDTVTYTVTCCGVSETGSSR